MDGKLTGLFLSADRGFREPSHGDDLGQADEAVHFHATSLFVLRRNCEGAAQHYNHAVVSSLACAMIMGGWDTGHGNG
jgi:hypothetical protein